MCFSTANLWTCHHHSMRKAIILRTPSLIETKAAEGAKWHAIFSGQLTGCQVFFSVTNISNFIKFLLLNTQVFHYLLAQVAFCRLGVSFPIIIKPYSCSNRLFTWSLILIKGNISILAILSPPVLMLSHKRQRCTHLDQNLLFVHFSCTFALTWTGGSAV